METFRVDASDEGMRLDIFAKAKLHDFSRSQIQRAIEQGLLLLNGAPATKHDRVRRGDVVTIERDVLQRPLFPSLAAQNIPFDVLYEDDDLLAVNKPAGLVVHPGNGIRDGTLVNALLHRVCKLSDGTAPERPGIVHRLDKETSGVMLVAKNNPTHDKLSAMFAARLVEKHYIAMCVGRRPSNDRGRIDAAIGRSRSDPTKQCVAGRGKAAATQYEVLRYACGILSVQFRPLTGRTHQIRVHASHAGFPIVGDKTYGGGIGRIAALPPMERSFARSIYACFSRHALHAWRLRVLHPITGKPLDIEAPLPHDFRRALELFENQLTMLSDT